MHRWGSHSNGGFSRFALLISGHLVSLLREQDPKASRSREHPETLPAATQVARAQASAKVAPNFLPRAGYVECWDCETIQRAERSTVRGCEPWP